jgi:DNA-binding NarL/FixJ family response regulator
VPIFGEPAETGTAAEALSTDALLAALAAGLKDDAIARQAGTSTRTVRRRITELATTLRARTRFQAGMLAERRGLLRDTDGTPR